MTREARTCGVGRRRSGATAPWHPLDTPERIDALLHAAWRAVNTADSPDDHAQSLAELKKAAEALTPPSEAESR